MAGELERVRKALRELGKSLESLHGESAPNDVHKLRTASRRVEAIAGVLQAAGGKKSWRLVKSIEPVRKTAGGVRDMDVLLADARKLARYRGGASLTRLIAHLETVRQQNAEQALVPDLHVRPMQMALAFARPCLAMREKAAQAGIGCSIRWIDQQGRAALQIEAAADDEADARYFGSFMRAHHTGERIAIHNAKRLDAKQGRGREQFLGRGYAAQEREMRRYLEIGVVHASPTP